ncbi:response regulator [candidate division WWE3 bacterium CG_4_10_14_0_2_um_filter_42_7]|uniref:Response regulator n=2 Tax=Katanobacteria TaxID=422282 RepID=A0A2H0XBY4_UNCKA|nr:MAG: response regulator [candidate division WWE3 bacterium CG08_land_8_20_14_0_20_41_15]PIZ43742.1 MAG: response regulator [candidate division WWE3 bacterium CG_4_10_14_0_2_um_filter_42_7]
MTKKILIVEDDDSLFAMYEPEFKLRGLALLRASNVEEGLKIARSEKPNVVLMDIVLPDKTGIQALGEMKADPELNKLPVIMLTNFGNEENISKAIDMGAEDFILKYKVVPSEVVDKIEQLLGESNEGMSTTNA